MNAKGTSTSPRAAKTAFRSGLVLFALPILLSLIMLPSAAQAAFPGANGQIAFQSTRDGNSEVYVMNADGSGQTNLTNNGAGDFDPDWSADGTKIAFSSDRDGNREIYVMNADGSGQTRLTNIGSWDYNPTWSPDGTKIAFASDWDPDVEIFVMNADGTGPTQLTFNTTFDDEPSWSPDGTKIAYINQVPGGVREIFVMNADGTGQANLTNNGGFNSRPDWSPDGTKIAYHSGAAFCGPNCEVFVMNADGSGQTNRTNNPASDSHPKWSPDGTRIVFQSNRDGPAGDIYTMNADGSALTRLTDNPASDGRSDWQPTSIVPPNNPPVAVCQDVQVSADENCEATIAPGDVDGGSYDPDGDDITLSLDNSGPFPLGEHTVTLTVTDEHAESDSCQATVTVVDNTVPAPTLTDPICVTVGKGKKTANKLTAGATDNCTQPTTVTIDNVQVFNNGGNPVHGNGVYDVVGNDIYVYPNGNGWTVRVTITAIDEAGNGTTSTITKPLLKCK